MTILFTKVLTMNDMEIKVFLEEANVKKDFISNCKENNLKCPFCQQELLLSSFRDGDKDNEVWNCLHCQIGSKRKLWQELIRTHKALDVAIRGLDQMTWGCDSTDAEDLLKEIKEITALEQKDK